MSYYPTPPPPPPPPKQQSLLPAPPPGQQQYGSQHPPIPTIQGHWLPDTLRDKSVHNLQHILNASHLQSALLSNPHTTHPSIPLSEQQHLTPLIQANLTAASHLEETEARLSDLRARTQSRLLALRALEQQHRGKIAETEAALRDFSPQALYQRLSASVQEQELLLSALEESWLDGEELASEREVADFVRHAKDATRLAFLRRERKRRWDDGRVGGWR